MVYSLLKKFRKSESGNFALIIALCAAPLFGGIALAADYVALNQQKSSLQEVVDGASLAVAKEMALANSKTLDVQNIAESYVSSQFLVPDSNLLTVTAEKGVNDDEIDVTASYVWKPFFIQYLNDEALPIVVSSKAGFAGGKSSICVISLNESENNALTISSNSSLTANKCSIYTNSNATSALSVDVDGLAAAENIFTSGGYTGAQSRYSPVPITDSPIIADPLSDRAAPTFGTCDKTDFVAPNNATVVLDPGVYCGGISAGGTTILKLNPGVYIIKDGPLEIKGDSSLIGDHVGFYFTGDTSLFDFGVSTQAVLTAPKSGPLSGILFFEDRNSPSDRVFTIRSKDAEKFEGTIYLPKGKLFIDKASRVGQASKWTAIIANKFEIGKGPQLQINSDYANSDVPVPEGITGDTVVRLLK